ncbi:hypothetical protein DESUT3_30270 [Desulfuromonas versatilis]|uniref:Peptidase S54 rhomboid domain-containing protein n=1 Tax=Desulfuromonas versatilis TaxID=2802975 RepID=A0ABM8HVK7_9BACT|nr:rhomboid family intramembrane serine protease [Desulfuromonas versatilis]BCR05958.1 hypothetical protein DESUT3_30270 [Desulfuromonas versatilis]
MLLPVGDTPNPRGTPWLNYLLIGVNVAVFLLVSLPMMMSRPDLSDPLLLEYLRALGARGAIPVDAVLEHVSAYDLAVFRYGYRPADPSLLTLFTSLFLHGGWLHLAGNMLFLGIFGDNVEHRLGRLNYLLAYLGAGIVATLFFSLFVPGSNIPLVGASGAISGVLGCYFIWFPRNRVKVFVFLFPILMNTFLVPARMVLGFYLVVDNLIPFLLTQGGGSGVAHGAHIGGFFGGLGLAWALERAPGLLERRRSQAAFRGQAGEGGNGEEPSLGGRITRLLGLGELPRAAALYESLPERAERLQVGDEAVLAIGEYLVSAGGYDRALAVFRRFIAERPRSPMLDRAFLGAGKALIHKPRCIPSAYQYFLAALDVAKSQELAEEARMHLRAIERLGEDG